MNAHKTILMVSGISAIAIAAALVAVGCSSDNGGTPTIDAGGGADSTASSSGSSSSGSSSGSGSSGSSGGSSSSGSSSGSSSSGGDAGAGACAPDGGSAFNPCPYAGTITCLPYNNAEAGVPSPLPTM
jgi:hypothetical protein